MGFIETLNFDFRDILHVDRKKFNYPLIPAVLQRVLISRYDLEFWKVILSKYKVKLTYSYTEEIEHEVYAEYHYEKGFFEIELRISNDQGVKELSFLLIQTLMHEFVHASQDNCNREHFEEVEYSHEDEFVDYISEWREIQAFAHCAFLEIMEYEQYPTKTVWYYDDTSKETRQKFFRFICRWSAKYGVDLSLKS